MNTRRLSFVTIQALLSFFLLSKSTVFSASEFSTSFISTYDIQESGLTNVHHQVQIKNNLSHLYTTKYSIVIGENKLTNVKVVNNSQTIAHQTINSDNTTTLNIKIPNPVVGKDKVTNLEIFYTSANIAEHSGNIWEINIPKLSKANEAEVYTRTVIFPNSFIKPTVEFPHPSNTISNDQTGKTTYYYEGFPTEGITLLFGNSQIYELDLTYLITNPSLNSTNTEIALPLDTDYQRVTLQSLTPKPEMIKLDSDQNWLAVYALKPDEKLRVEAKVYIELFPQPNFTAEAISLDRLTSPQEFWEAKNPTISSLADKLKTPQNIYNYLLNNLSYNYARVGVDSQRLGALQTLASPTSAISSEFTDTFIALARSLNIPAREINGYAHTNNEILRPLELAIDVLHAWPEYYDENSGHWLQIDPTWGKTTGEIDYFSKMDFNHLAFVRHGQESSYPYPAGAYKLDSREKTVSVKLAKTLPPPITTYKLTSSGSTTTVINTGNVAFHDFPITLNNGSSYTIAYLPPYGQEIISPSKTKIGFFQRLLTLIQKIFAPFH